MEDWREKKRSDGAWSTFLCGAVDKVVYVEVRQYTTPSPHLMNYPMPKYPLRLLDFDDHNVVCIGEDGIMSQIFSRKDIVSISCVEDPKKLNVSGSVLRELMGAYASDKKIDFIKRLREATGMRLKEAKDIAEDVWKHGAERYLRDGGEQ